MDFTAGAPLVEVEPRPTFNVVIAYDTAESARRALRLVEGIDAEFVETFAVRRNLWRFDIIDLPAARDEVSATSARADLIVVATGMSDLPAPVKAWLEHWSAEAIPGTTALVALLRTPSRMAPGPSPAHRFLESLARRAGQDFFATESIVAPATVGLDFEGIHQRVNQPTSTLLDILARSEPVPRWGLNE
jgi:hypothetical protein